MDQRIRAGASTSRRAGNGAPSEEGNQIVESDREIQRMLVEKEAMELRSQQLKKEAEYYRELEEEHGLTTLEEVLAFERLQMTTSTFKHQESVLHTEGGDESEGVEKKVDRAKGRELDTPVNPRIFPCLSSFQDSSSSSYYGFQGRMMDPTGAYFEEANPTVFYRQESESTTARFDSGTLSHSQDSYSFGLLAYQDETAASSGFTRQPFRQYEDGPEHDKSSSHDPSTCLACSSAGPSNSIPRRDEGPRMLRDSKLARYVNAPVFVPRRELGSAYANDNKQMVVSSSSAAPMNALTFYRTFEPSRAISDRPRAISLTVALRAHQLGVSLQTSYQGDIDHDFLDNATAPWYVNCAVYMIYIPAQANLRELIAVIQGKIFSLSLSPPTADFEGCAASLVFATRAAALAFLSRGSSPGIYIRGQRIKVTWDRNIRRPLSLSLAYQSRVLQIQGPASQLDAGEFIRLFADNIQFRLVNMREWIISKENKIVELEFCSIQGQSRSAMKLFYSYIQGTWMDGIFFIQYAPDPCDPLDSATLGRMTF